MRFVCNVTFAIHRGHRRDECRRPGMRNICFEFTVDGHATLATSARGVIQWGKHSRICTSLSASIINMPRPAGQKYLLNLTCLISHFSVLWAQSTSVTSTVTKLFSSHTMTPRKTVSRTRKQGVVSGAIRLPRCPCVALRAIVRVVHQSGF